MNIVNYQIRMIGSCEYKVEKKNIDWDDILLNEDAFYDELASIILDERFLYYFCSNNSDSKFLLNKLTDKQKNKIKCIFNNLLKDPESFYDNYKKEETLLDKLKSVNSIDDLKKFASKYGIKYKESEKKLSIQKSNIMKSIKKESAYGVFGEIMFYIVVEMLINNRKLLISKLNFISAPGTYAHGSDGIFLDKKNNKIYFGEAKFTFDIKSAMEQALDSCSEFKTRIENDKNFILVNEGSFKNDYKLEIFDDDKINNFKKCIVVFAFHGEEYLDLSIKDCLNKYCDKFKILFDNDVDIELISFPIISKEKFKKKLSKKVSDSYENY